MALRLRSAAVTDGAERAPNRAMLRSVGFCDDDFGKPLIGIASAFSTLGACNAGLDELARIAEIHRLAGVEKNPHSKLAFLLVKLQKQTIEPAIEIPVEITKIVARNVVAMIGEFDRLAARAAAA